MHRSKIFPLMSVQGHKPRRRSGSGVGLCPQHIRSRRNFVHRSERRQVPTRNSVRLPAHCEIRSAMSCNATHCRPRPSASARQPGRLSFGSIWRCWLGPLFTAEVLTLRGLMTYYVLFFIHLESRRVNIGGIRVHPDEQWMQQIARNMTMEGCGALRGCRYLLHDRDTKYTQSFRAIIASGQVEPLALPARSPNLNAYSERWVRSVKEECLSKVILFGERSLRRALSEYVEHYHAERNHRGRATSCCSLGVRTSAAPGLFNAASDWATLALLPSGGSMNGGSASDEFFDLTRRSFVAT